jgi:hypothetical protein
MMIYDLGSVGISTVLGTEDCLILVQLVCLWDRVGHIKIINLETYLVSFRRQ